MVAHIDGDIQDLLRDNRVLLDELGNVVEPSSFVKINK